MATSQDGRSLQLSTPLGEDFLLINRFRCYEGLNQLFHIELDLLHEEEFEGFTPTKVDSKQLLGSGMVLAALQAGDTVRYFHGMCNMFSQSSRNQRFSEYRAELVPSVWLLTQVSQSRIFQQKSVPDILTEVLAGFEFQNEIQGTFEPRNYCVQYRETDWDFASRLMEEEGIYYYFEHTEDTHKLVLANTPESHRPCPDMPQVTYALDRSELEDQWVPAVYSWQVDDRVRTGKHELRDFNFQLPANSLEAKQTSRFNVGGNNKLENYDYPGGYAKRFDGIDKTGGEQAGELNKIFSDRERTIHIRQEEIDVVYKTYLGSGNLATLTAGYRFELIDHPIREYNAKYVLTSVWHESIQSPAYISDEIRHDGYSMTFSCIPHGGGHAPFRPERKTPKPVVRGSQTAFVVGTPGEEIFTDKYGRVKVQFHWDRKEYVDQRSSCWLRVAQALAGNRWGSMFIPRIGTEVLVDFLEGDPDRPIITGCVYNAANLPPYDLPDNKTRSTLKTNSTKGGMGFNEFRIEDKKGEEQIFVHAEKNLDIRVKNDCLETIKRDRHLIVEAEQFEHVKKDKHLKVTYNHNEEIGGTMSLKIGVDHQEKVGSNYALDAGTNVHIKAGASAVIEAGASLTLKVGGNFVNINSSGVFIKGSVVMLNSGGAAGTGAGANPELPKPPKEADTAEAGQRVHIPRALPPPQPPDFAAAAAAIREVRLEDNVPPPAAGGGDQDDLLMQSNVRAESARAAVQEPPPSIYVQPPAQEAPPQSQLPANYVEPPVGGQESIAAPVPPGYADPSTEISGPGSAYLQSAGYATPFIGN